MRAFKTLLFMTYTIHNNISIMFFNSYSDLHSVRLHYYIIAFYFSELDNISQVIGENSQVLSSSTK